jgi:large subunit ribosomal protein L4
MEVKVLDFNGKILEESSTFWFSIEPNNHAVYLDVKQYLANQRQGTHKAKERAEVREVHVRLKQKELVLLVRVVEPLFKGVEQFGPRPRSYSFKLNKTWKFGKKICFSIKAKESNIIVLEDFNFETHKISLMFWKL